MRLDNQINKINSKLWQRFSICLLINLIIIITTFGQTTDQTKPELVVQTGHTDNVRSVAFSPNGKMVASGSWDITIKLWDVSTGQELRTLQGHTNMVESVAFSPDGKTLASGSRDSIIKLWDVESGQELRTLQSQSYSISSVTFSPDGKTLASGDGNVFGSNGVDSTIKLWNVENGQLLKSLEGHTAFVESVAFSLDGKTLASGSLDKNIKLWNVESGQELRTLQGHTSSIFSVAFSPDGKILASGSADDTLKLWNVASGQELRAFKAHTDAVKTVAFSPDGKILASGSANNVIKLWDVVSGQELKILQGHTDVVNSIAFSPNGKILASGSRDIIKLWDVESGKELKTLQGNILGSSKAAFSLNGKILASTSWDKTIKLWNAESGQEFRTLQGHTAFVESVAFSPDGKMLASGGSCEIDSRDGCLKAEVKLWDVASGKELKTLQGHTNIIHTVAFTADGKTLASGGWDKTIKLWDVASGSLIKSFNLYDDSTKDEVSAIVPDYYEQDNYAPISQDGRFQIELGENGKLNLYEVKSGKHLATLMVLDEKDWLITTPDGLFDGSPNSWKQLIWRFDNNTFDYAPVEAFFKEFYRPGLLQDIFNGVPIEPPTTDLAKIDIRQPSVKITAVDGKAVDSSALLLEKVSAEKKNIKVKVEITDNVNAPRAGISKDSSSDAQDVRLFRNGSMVKFWGKVDEKTKRSVSIFDFTEKDGCKQIPASGNSPRKAVCETEIAITAGENELTVYGFNYQDVKSSDNTALVVGAETLKREGTLYVLAIGVNKYKNTDYNLNFAVKDVQEIGTALQEQQTKLGNVKQYAKTEVITLTDNLATKENILYALKRFAGGEKDAVSENISDELKTQLNKIKQTQPEDALVIYFAGHGVSKGQRFYLLPHNFTGDAKLLESESVSDLELNEYLEKVDAGKILMTIDACQSGQALGGKNDGKAPMNSKGFAQLAYDKGMFILTAAQSQQAALEAVNLNGKIIENGLLTYTLLEALKDKETDNDGDSKIFEKEWFDYATSKVPQMQLEAMKNRSVEVSKGEKDKNGKRKVEIFYVEGDEEEKADERRVQTPRIFYKRETDANPLIVAKP